MRIPPLSWGCGAVKLFITNGAADTMEGTVLKPSDLNANIAHLVISSRKWDAIYIEVSEEIGEGQLRYLHTKTGSVIPRVPGEPSRHQMILLTELFPDKAGTIRAAFMKGADIRGVLPAVWE